MESARRPAPYKRVILTPRSNPQRLYAKSGRETLQSRMGLRDVPDEFREILKLIREVWVEHGVEIQVPYKHQDPSLMQKIKEEVIRRLPFLAEQYEDAWPVTFYLKRALKCHLSMEARRTTRKSGPSTHHTQQNRLPNLGRVYTSPSAFNREPQDHGTSVNPSVTIEGSSTSSVPSSSSTIPIPTSASTIASPSNTPSIRDMLLSFGLPVPDVERIHSLLHAQGVSDIAYLRVLARMHSRDGWLHEMREKGEALAMCKDDNMKGWIA